MTAPVAPEAQEADALAATLDEQAPRGPRRIGRRAKDITLAFVVLLPSAVIFVTFFFYPLYRLFYLGLHQQNRFGTAERYVGFSQYKDVLTSHNFLDGLRISTTYVLYTVPIGLVLGTLLAVAANRRLRGIKIFQTIFASTVASSVAVASVVFLVLINPQVGYFRDVSFFSLSDPDTALRGVALSSVWQNLGLSFIIVLAGLQAVPDELYEAAALDGYGPDPPLLPRHAAADLAHAHVPRRGARHFRLPGLRPGRHPHRWGAGRIDRDARLEDLQQSATDQSGRRAR